MNTQRTPPLARRGNSSSSGRQPTSSSTRTSVSSTAGGSLGTLGDAARLLRSGTVLGGGSTETITTQARTGRATTTTSSMSVGGRNRTESSPSQLPPASDAGETMAGSFNATQTINTGAIPRTRVQQQETTPPERDDYLGFNGYSILEGELRARQSEIPFTWNTDEEQRHHQHQQNEQHQQTQQMIMNLANEIRNLSMRTSQNEENIRQQREQSRQAAFVQHLRQNQNHQTRDQAPGNQMPSNQAGQRHHRNEERDEQFFEAPGFMPSNQSGQQRRQRDDEFLRAPGFEPGNQSGPQNFRYGDEQHFHPEGIFDHQRTPSPPLSIHVSRSRPGEYYQRTAPAGVVVSRSRNPTKPSFSGGGSEDPVLFLEELDNYVAEWRGDNRAQICEAMSCFKGSAENYMRAFRSEVGVYADLRQLFLEHFWGEEVQMNFLVKLKVGPFYNKNSGVSAVDYFINLWARCQQLDRPMQPHKFIQEVSNHFNNEIRLELKGLGNIKDAIRAIERAEIRTSTANQQIPFQYNQQPYQNYNQQSNQHYNQQFNHQNQQQFQQPRMGAQGFSVNRPPNNNNFQQPGPSNSWRSGSNQRSTTNPRAAYSQAQSRSVLVTEEAMFDRGPEGDVEQEIFFSGDTEEEPVTRVSTVMVDEQFLLEEEAELAKGGSATHCNFVGGRKF